MKAAGQWLVLLWLTAICLGCRERSPFMIEPISAETNQALLTGKGLDLRLYGTKNIFQYYQVDGYKDLSAEALASKLEHFISNRYLAQKNIDRESISIWFYRKRLFGDYRALVLESARENENGGLTDHKQDAVGLIYLEFSEKGKTLKRHTYLYYPIPGEPFADHDNLNLER